MSAPRKEALRIGVAGCGAAAEDLIRAASEVNGVEVSAAFDIDARRVQAFEARHGVRGFNSLEGVLDVVDALYVALPHHLLPGVAEAAMTRGRHVLAEKPLALDAFEAQRLGAVADRAGVSLGVYFELRATEAVRWARAAVYAGMLGDVRSIRITTLIDKPAAYWSAGAASPDGKGWRARTATAGGGVMLMNVIHLLDVARFVSGLDVVRVSAESASWTPGLDVEEVCSVTARLSNGAVLNIVGTSQSAGASDEETVSFEGEHGRLDLPYLLSDDAPRLYLRRDWEGLPVGVWHQPELPSSDCYADTVRGFCDATRGAESDLTECLAGAEDAARALSVVSAIYESAREGRPVTIGQPAAR